MVDLDVLIWLALAALLAGWVDAIAGGDAQAAHDVVAQLMRLPQEAEAAMRSTPIGEKPHIRVAQRPPLQDWESS